MNDLSEILLGILGRIQEEKNHTDFCLTIKGRNDKAACIQVYSWHSEDGPDEDLFKVAAVLEGDFDMESATIAADMALSSSVVISFAAQDSNSFQKQQQLSLLMEGVPDIHLSEFWANWISWRLLLRAIPVNCSQTWASLTSLGLHLVMNTREDEEYYRKTLNSGPLRRFLDQLKMLRKLSLSFYSELQEHDDFQFHAPLEHILDTSTNWPNLENLELEYVDSTAQELLVFLESHRLTLRDLTLRNYTLLSGSWIKTLCKVRRLLSLEAAEVAGSIAARGELWLIKDVILAEDLGFWLTNRDSELPCPLTYGNMTR